LFLAATDFDQTKTFRLNRTIVFRGQTFAVNSVATASLHLLQVEEPAAVLAGETARGLRIEPEQAKT